MTLIVLSTKIWKSLSILYKQTKRKMFKIQYQFLLLKTERDPDSPLNRPYADVIIEAHFKSVRVQPHFMTCYKTIHYKQFSNQTSTVTNIQPMEWCQEINQTKTLLWLKQMLLEEYKNLKCCEVRIENCVTGLIVRYHEACRVIPNSYPERRIFN